MVTDCPAVGVGLHDHPNAPVFFKAKADIDCFYPQLYSFFRTNEESDLPPGQSDTCYVYWPAPSAMKQMAQRMVPPKVIPHALYGPRSRELVRKVISGTFKVDAVQGFTDRMFGIILILGKPKSRGTLRLRSTDPNDQALIDPAYYSNPEDMQTMIKGIRPVHARSAMPRDWPTGVQRSYCLAPVCRVIVRSQTTSERTPSPRTILQALA